MTTGLPAVVFDVVWCGNCLGAVAPWQEYCGHCGRPRRMALRSAPEQFIAAWTDESEWRHRNLEEAEPDTIRLLVANSATIPMHVRVIATDQRYTIAADPPSLVLAPGASQEIKITLYPNINYTGPALDKVDELKVRIQLEPEGAEVVQDEVALRVGWQPRKPPIRRLVRVKGLRGEDRWYVDVLPDPRSPTRKVSFFPPEAIQDGQGGMHAVPPEGAILRVPEPVLSNLGIKPDQTTPQSVELALWFGDASDSEPQRMEVFASVDAGDLRRTADLVELTVPRFQPGEQMLGLPVLDAPGSRWIDIPMEISEGDALAVIHDVRLLRPPDGAAPDVPAELSLGNEVPRAFPPAGGRFLLRVEIPEEIQFTGNDPLSLRILGELSELRGVQLDLLDESAPFLVRLIRTPKEGREWVIGIDLGTSNTVLAWGCRLRGDDPQRPRDPVYGVANLGPLEEPTPFHITSRLMVGPHHRGLEPTDAVRDVPIRDIKQKFMQLLEESEGDAGVPIRHDEIIEAFLGELLQRLQHLLPVQLATATFVFTFPARWEVSTLYRKNFESIVISLLERLLAAKPRVVFVDEGTAAAILPMLDYLSVHPTEDPRRIWQMVVDVGGGTTDPALVEVDTAHVPPRMRSIGRSFTRLHYNVGGENFTRSCYENLQKSAGISWFPAYTSRRGRIMREKFRDLARAVKEGRCRAWTQTDFPSDMRSWWIDERYRPDLEAASRRVDLEAARRPPADLVQHCRAMMYEIVDGIVQAVRAEGADVLIRCLLTGGGARLPLVQELFDEAIGRLRQIMGGWDPGPLLPLIDTELEARVLAWPEAMHGYEVTIAQREDTQAYFQEYCRRVQQTDQDHTARGSDATVVDNSALLHPVDDKVITAVGAVAAVLARVVPHELLPEIELLVPQWSAPIHLESAGRVAGNTLGNRPPIIDGFDGEMVGLEEEDVLEETEAPLRMEGFPPLRGRYRLVLDIDGFRQTIGEFLTRRPITKQDNPALVRRREGGTTVLQLRWDDAEALPVERFAWWPFPRPNSATAVPGGGEP